MDAKTTRKTLDVVLLGPVGAGKGTQAKLINQKLGIPHIASGDLLRAHRQSGTELGRQADSYMKTGALVPDALVINMIRERMGNEDAARGVLLDGFPRTVTQAEALETEFKKLGRSIDHVIYLAVPESVLVERLSGRWTCRTCQTTYHIRANPPKVAGVCDACGGELYQRDDDLEEVVAERIRTYVKNTIPVIGYYRERGTLREVDGTRDISAVAAEVAGILDAR